VNSWKAPADVCIVKLRFGWSIQQVAIYLRRHVDVSVDGTTDELDFEGVKSFAITHCRQRMRMDGLTRNSRANLTLFRGSCRMQCQQRNRDNKKMTVAVHETHNCLNNVFQRAQASSRAFRFSSVASGFSPSRMNP